MDILNKIKATSDEGFVEAERSIDSAIDFIGESKIRNFLANWLLKNKKFDSIEEFKKYLNTAKIGIEKSKDKLNEFYSLLCLFLFITGLLFIKQLHSVIWVYYDIMEGDIRKKMIFCIYFVIILNFSCYVISDRLYSYYFTL